MVFILYNVTAYPISYIIDEEGIIQKFHRGYMDEDTLKDFLDTMIRKLEEMGIWR